MHTQPMISALGVAALAIMVIAGCGSDESSNPTGIDAAKQGVTAIPVTGANGVERASTAATRTYRVTIKNLTGEQPLSPGVVVTHTKQHSLFEVGSTASEGIRLIAENGDPSVAETEQTGAPGVHAVVATPAPVGCVGCPGPFASTLVVEIQALANANRLSAAVMLICTNDGFTGLSGVKLPGGFEPRTYLTRAYDAGTELNDELYTSIVDPCGAIGPVSAPADGSNDRPATSQVITHHPGIDGGGNLDPAAHGWSDPVAEITIQRMR